MASSTAVTAQIHTSVADRHYLPSCSLSNTIDVLSLIRWSAHACLNDTSHIVVQCIDICSISVLDHVTMGAYLHYIGKLELLYLDC